MKVYHLEANGSTNTGFYVNKIIKAVSEQVNDDSSKVFTSNKNIYPSQNAIAVFSKYSEASKLNKIWYYLLGWIRLVKILLENPENKAFHFHWLKFSPLDYYFLKKLKSKGNISLISTVHNILPHEQMFYDKRYFKKIYSLVDHLTVHSNSIKLKLIDQFSVNEDKITLIPHYGYDKLGSYVACDNVRILFFGSIRKYKGLNVLIESLSEINTHNWQLNIYGKPETDIQHLISYTKENQLTSKVNWYLGWIDEEKISEIFNSHDIIVLPYISVDNSGLLHLAMSYGKIIIASEIGVITDLINNGENGLLFPAGDRKKLAQCIEEVTRDIDKYRPLGQRAAELMEKEHNLETIAKQHLELYHEFI